MRYTFTILEHVFLVPSRYEITYIAIDLGYDEVSNCEKFGENLYARLTKKLIILEDALLVFVLESSLSFSQK